MLISDWSSTCALPISVVRDSGAFPMHRHMPVERQVYPVCIANRVDNVSRLPHRKALAHTVRSVAGSTPCAGRSEERRVGKECVSSVDLGGRRVIQRKQLHKNNIYSDVIRMRAI